MASAGLREAVDRIRRGLAPRPDDGELLERYVADRDEAAFAELVERHGPRVYAVCRRILGSHHLAEDAFQATFLVLARKAAAVRPRAAVGGFLFGVARRAALEAHAAGRRRREVTVGTVAGFRSVDQEAPEFDALAMLDEEIATLPDGGRAAVVLCELDGVGRAEAARRLGIPEGTLSSRLAAPRRRLAARLRARGVTLSAGLLAASAASADAAVPPPFDFSALSAHAIAEGVLRTMTLTKWKLTVAIGVLAAGLGLWSLPIPTGSTAAAAPVPKVDEREAGLIWNMDWRGNDLQGPVDLIAYTPGGRKAKEVTLAAGERFLGLTADGQKVAFVDRDAKMWPAGATKGATKGATIRSRDLGAAAGGEDTGLPYVTGYMPHWSPDRRRAVRETTHKADLPGGGVRWTYSHALYDVATGTWSKLDLPDDCRVDRWSPDGRWLLVRKEDGYMTWFRYTLADGKRGEPLVRDYYCHYSDLSPDGKTLLAHGYFRDDPDQVWALRRFDLDSGGVAVADKFATTPRDSVVVARWSPDGKRIACCVRERDREPPERESARFVVCDPDGGNQTVLARRSGQIGGLILWLPTSRAVQFPPQ